MVAVTDSTGALITQQRYLPFGGQRQLSGYQTTGLTDFGYTGQRALDEGMGGLMDYKARFYSPYLNRFLQPDTIIPDGTQGLNRYSYVRNSPINFNDPTGHTWVCTGANDDHCYDDGEGEISANTHRARQVWKFFHDKGLIDDVQGAMEYLVDTEFGWSILESVMAPTSQGNNLFSAVTRHYWSYCKGGSWTGECLNNFWAYHQGPLTGAKATGISEKYIPYVESIASAILNPGKEFSFGIKASEGWKNGCSDGGLCHYAVARSGLSDWVKFGGYGIPASDKSGTYSIDRSDLGWLLYMYPAGGSDNFVLMNQDMWNWLNINHSDFLWNGN